MCNYEYCQYDICGHQIIELRTYCVQALWRAGMTGSLQPCPEDIYISYILRIKLPATSEERYNWRGLSGYCKHCEDRFDIPKTFHYPTHNDTSMAGAGNGAIAVVHPKFTLARMPSVFRPFFSSSSDISEISICVPQALPYIYTPWISRTIFQLLSIDDQYSTIDHANAPELFFPSNLATYDLKSSSTSWCAQWISKAHISGVRAAADSYYIENGGLSPQDRKTITSLVAKGLGFEEIWSTQFKERGMGLQSFLVHAPKIETFVVGQAWEDALKWERYIQKGSLAHHRLGGPPPRMGPLNFAGFTRRYPCGALRPTS